MRPLVSFDCYTTLVDFQLDRATREILSSKLGLDGVDEDAFFRDFHAMRFQEVLDDYKPYREVLKRSLSAAMLLHRMPYEDEDGEALVAAVTTFGPFPEVPDALRALKQKYDIAIISNTDDNLIKYNVENIGVEFEYVISAEQARAYKPTQAAFEFAFSQFGRERDDHIHVAQGFEYDIMPTKRFGIRRVWINRYGLRGSSQFEPYEELEDLSRLPELLGA